MDAGWIVVTIFLAVLAVVVFAVARGMWRIWRGEPRRLGAPTGGKSSAAARRASRPGVRSGRGHAAARSACNQGLAAFRPSKKLVAFSMVASSWSLPLSIASRPVNGS